MGQADQSDPLFTALAEQLKMPLIQIARLSELAGQANLQHISVISDRALHLVDAYVQVQSQNQTKLLLEPLTSSAVLYDVATTLSPLAKYLDYEIEVDLHGRGVPIMAHRDSLRTMLTLLGASLLEVNGEEDQPRRLVLGTHNSARGIVVGAFSSQLAVTQRALRLTRQLHGRAAQAAPSLGQAGGAGLAIADRLSEQMSAPLKAYRHRSMSGIGSLLLPSRQLQLVR